MKWKLFPHLWSIVRVEGGGVRFFIGELPSQMASDAKFGAFFIVNPIKWLSK